MNASLIEWIKKDLAKGKKARKTKKENKKATEKRFAFIKPSFYKSLVHYILKSLLLSALICFVVTQLLVQDFREFAHTNLNDTLDKLYKVTSDLTQKQESDGKEFSLEENIFLQNAIRNQMFDFRDLYVNNSYYLTDLLSFDLFLGWSPNSLADIGIYTLDGEEVLATNEMLCLTLMPVSNDRQQDIYAKQPALQAWHDSSSDEKLHFICDNITYVKPIFDDIVRLRKKEHELEENQTTEQANQTFYSIMPTKVLLTEGYFYPLDMSLLCTTYEGQMSDATKIETQIIDQVIYPPYPAEILDHATTLETLDEHLFEIHSLSGDTYTIYANDTGMGMDDFVRGHSFANVRREPVLGNNDTILTPWGIRKNRSDSIRIGGQRYNLVIQAEYNLWRCASKQLLFIYAYMIVGIFILNGLLSVRSYHKQMVRFEVNAYRSKTMNAFAHDLKTPLMAILGSAENIALATRDEKVKHYSDSIQDSALYMNELVSNIFQLSKIESGQIQIQKEMLDMKELLCQIQDEYEILLQTKKLRLQISGEASIEADEALMKQIFHNLLGNAVKYAKEKSTIKVSLSMRELTFENEYEGDLQVAQGEHGLGLAIVKDAAFLQGFKLHLTSDNHHYLCSILL